MANPIQLTYFESMSGSGSFSPDGRQLAFTSDAGGNYDIYVKRIGSEVHLRRTDDPASDVAPAWSPDGHWIAFAMNSGPLSLRMHSGTPYITNSSAKRLITYSLVMLRPTSKVMHRRVCSSTMESHFNE